MNRDKNTFFESIALFIVIIGGFIVLILCLQPIDGGINKGIGGWRAILVALYVIASGYLIFNS